MTLVLQQLFNGLSRGSVYALIAVGFALIFSVLKFSNFAHGGVMSIGAFAGFFFAGVLKLNPVVSVLLTAAVGALVGIVLDTIAFKRLRRRKSPDIFYFVSSITAGMLFMNILTIFFGTTFYSIPAFFTNQSIKLGNVVIIKNDIMIFLVSMLFLVALLLLINKTAFGLALRAISLNIDTAKLMGINIDWVVLVTFMMAGGLGGIAGIFLGLNFTVDPFIGNMMVKGFIASVIGGLGSISGAIWGALLLGVIEVVLTILLGDNITPAIVFIFTLLFLLIRPQGISGKNIQEKA
jgi:branched-chain amino acid transport system permease protein